MFVLLASTATSLAVLQRKLYNGLLRMWGMLGHIPMDAENILIVSTVLCLHGSFSNSLPPTLKCQIYRKCFSSSSFILIPVGQQPNGEFQSSLSILLRTHTSHILFMCRTRKTG